MRPRWCKVDEAFFAAATAGHNGSYHLTVEQLPDHDGWDWTVWRPGEAPEVARHGQALSVEAALPHPTCLPSPKDLLRGLRPPGGASAPPCAWGEIGLPKLAPLSSPGGNRPR